MKKVLLLFAIIILGVVVILSCSSDDSLAKAEMSFQGVLIAVDYSDKVEEDVIDEESGLETETSEDSDLNEESDAKTEDGYEYEKAIAEALADLSIIGEKSLIKESAKVDISDINYARALCFQQAKPKIDARIDQLTFHQVIYAIYKVDMENMNKLGYKSPDEIPLKYIKATINYYSVDWAPIIYNIVLK